jgi:lipoprotein-anchoring transpeptidase ErfK/SrfK
MQMVLEIGDYVLVYLPYSGENFYVPKKYVNVKADHIGELTQVVTVDRKNQNAVVLEYAAGGGRIVSLSYVSTGKTGGSSMPTPLGAYATLGKASKFFYYGDSNKKLYAGFAPYAVRFTGGVWLHGVPHDIPADPETGKVPIPKTYRETNSTMGTTPQSHGCVRNYTSHAKFLYEWLKVGSSAVAVID